MPAIVQVLTISELERASGVPRSTIHFYVRQGLLPPPQKTSGTRALWSESHVDLLARIGAAKAAGHSLPEIQAGLQAELDHLSENGIDLEAQEYERVHHDILRFATKQLMRKGYKRTHVADLIRDMKISSSIFYTHFPSKHQLLVECFSTFMQWGIAFVEAEAARSDDVVERLLFRTAASFSIHGLGADVMALVSAERLQGDTELRKPVEEAWGNVLSHIVAELQAMRAPGDQPPAVPDAIVAHSLNAALQTTLSRAIWDPQFSLLDVVRTHIWLWLAIKAAMAGQVDVAGQLAAYEEIIRRTVASPPPVFPALDE